MRARSDGGAERFASVYEASYGAIYAYAARRVGVAAADEIAAETFLVAWRRVEELPDEPLPWLYGVARHIVMRHRTAGARRRQTVEALHRERGLEEEGVDPVGNARLWEAWELLGPADREVLALVAWEDLTVADAARVLGCPARVFSVRLYRARRRFERLLEPTDTRPARCDEFTRAEVS